ncbi:MAG: hypothetical protein ACJ74J_11915 [Blastocatellia bacterium]
MTIDETRKRERRQAVLPRVTFYWRIEEGYLDLVRHFLDDLKESGYGKRKSIGYGQIEQVTPLALFTDFEDVPDANGFVTLSRFVPRARRPDRRLLESRRQIRQGPSPLIIAAGHST